MSELGPIKEQDRRVANIKTAEFTPFFSKGMPDGEVLQLNDAKPLAGNGRAVMRGLRA